MGAAAQPARETRALDTTAQVETPEHIRFDYPLAGPTRRAVAYLIDLLIRIGVALVVLLLLAMVEVAVGGLDGVSMGAFFIFYFALDWFYYVFFETIWSGRSPGKRALRLRVVGQDGHSLTVLDSVLRNLLRAADFLPFGYAVGLVIMGRDPMFRRFGDMVAGTVVVVEDLGRINERLELHPPPTPQELASIPERPDISREELESIELFMRRRGTLAPVRAIELAEMVAPVLARRWGGRYHDPARFLGLIYARVRGQEAVEPPRQPQPSRSGLWGRGRRQQQRHEPPKPSAAPADAGVRWNWSQAQAVQGQGAQAQPGAPSQQPSPPQAPPASQSSSWRPARPPSPPPAGEQPIWQPPNQPPAQAEPSAPPIWTPPGGES